jgi:class 3 adenylate cyclase
VKFVILVKATKNTEAGVLPTEELLQAQLDYNESVMEAGAWRDGVGLRPTRDGWRVHYEPGGARIEEGPFEDEGLIAGFMIIEVGSREEAVEWSLRHPKPAFPHEWGIHTEVRQVFGLDDFVQGPAIARFRELEVLERMASDAGRDRPDLSAAAAPNGTVTLLFSDIEGSTQLTEGLGDLQWMALLREHNELVRHHLAEHHGFEVKAQGDGFMLAFASAREALHCAIGIQRALTTRDPEAGPELRVRIGLHTGEAIKEADDFFGKAVILAARFAAEARGSEILVSSLVRELVEHTGEFAFEDPTDTELKGLAGMYRVSAVRWREDAGSGG